MVKSNGRKKSGQFDTGNKLACNHAAPHAASVALLRRTLLETFDAAARCRVVKGLIAQAEGGNVAAARTLFLYSLGHPPEPVCEVDKAFLYERAVAAEHRAIERATNRPRNAADLVAEL